MVTEAEQKKKANFRI